MDTLFVVVDVVVNVVASVAAPVLLLTATGLTVGLLLTFAARRYPANDSEVVRMIDQLLPQTQCAQCGYPGCKPYAEAIAKGEAINLCPPGGQATIDALAALLGRSSSPLDADGGQASQRLLAVIREAECIGCTLCSSACPVDAIVGAPQLMHTILQDICTGCDLCREPCPVDCIDLLAHPEPDPVVSFPESTQVCIDCGRCEPACPRQLQPQLLYLYREVPTRTAALNIDDCIECRACDNVCPSALPLTASFQAAKRLTHLNAVQRSRAELAEQRFI
ncbi:MAG: electron transport complex subunit RsxB, partial [Pseudomonadales bacterium]